jgi:hypothetical protein
LGFFASTLYAGTSDVTLAWDPPEVATDVTGYIVYQGAAPGIYPIHYDAGNALTYTVLALTDGTYYFVVTAYNIRNQESPYSNEVHITTDTAPPMRPQNLRSVSIKVIVDTRAGTITTVTTTGK